MGEEEQVTMEERMMEGKPSSAAVESRKEAGLLYPQPPQTARPAGSRGVHLGFVKDQNGFDSQAHRPDWAKGELGWLVGLGNTRDEHQARVDARIRRMRDVRKPPPSAGHSGASGLLPEAIGQRPVTTTGAQRSNSSAPGGGIVVPPLNVEKVINGAARNMSSRQSARSAIISARTTSRGCLTSRPTSRQISTPGFMSERTNKGCSIMEPRPPPFPAGEARMLASGGNYHVARTKICALGTYKMQKTIESSGEAVMRKRSQIHDTLAFKDDPSVMHATYRRLVGQDPEMGAPPPLDKGKGVKPASRFQTISHQDQRIMTWLTDPEFQRTDSDDALSVETPHTLHTSGVPRRFTREFQRTESADSHMTARTVEGSELSEPISESHRHSIQKKIPEQDQVTASVEPPRKKKLSKKQREEQLDDQMQQIRCNFSSVTSGLREMNSAMREWLRSGGSHVAMNNVTNEVVIKSWKPPNEKQTLAGIASNAQEQNARITAVLSVNPSEEKVEVGDHFLHENKVFTDAIRPHNRNSKLLVKTIEGIRRQDEVLNRKLIRDRQVLEHLQVTLEKKLPGAKALARIKVKDEEHYDQTRRSIIATLYAYIAAKRMEKIKWRGMIESFRRRVAIIKIQKQIRNWSVQRRRRGGQIWAKCVLRKFVTGVISALRLNAKGQSADKIKLFLHGLKEQAKVLPAILKYKAKVILIQQHIKAFLLRKRERDIANSQMWITVEKKELRNLGKEKARRRSMFMGESVGSQDIMRNTREHFMKFALPGNIKVPVLKRWLTAKKKHFMHSLTAYKLSVSNYTRHIEQHHLLTVRMMEFTGKRTLNPKFQTLNSKP